MRYLRRIVFVVSISIIATLAWGSILMAQGPPKGADNSPPAQNDYQLSQEWMLRENSVAARNKIQAASAISVTNIPCVNGYVETGLAAPNSRFPCANVDLLAWIPLAELGVVNNPATDNGNDSWGWTDPLSGKEYAIMGSSNGTSFVDISTPTNPIILGMMPPNTALNFSHLWGDYKVYANTMYKINESAGEGMQVFDLTQLRTATPGTVFTHTTVYTGFGSAHNVVINEDTGYAYAVGTDTSDDVFCPGGGTHANSGGLHIIDLSTPLTPSFVSCFNDAGYTHDAQCVIYAGPDGAYTGNEICFNSNEDKIAIVDVTNKMTPTLVSTDTYSTASYTHQGWLTEDHRYFISNDEGDEPAGTVPGTTTYLWDVQDLDDPVFMGIYFSGNTSIDHNLYITNSLVYEANNQDGLRIIDSSNIANADLSEVAFFDSYPEGRGASSLGAWNIYPFFESGVLVVSDDSRGLFLLDAQPGFRLVATPPNGPANRAPAVTYSACLGQSFDYDIDVNSFMGFNTAVNLNVSGATVGTSPGFAASFSPASPVTPGMTTTLTLSPTGGMLTTGNYSVSVEGNTTANDHQIIDLPFYLADTPIATLLNPTDTLTDVAPSPALQWMAGNVGSTTYLVEIATDAGFSTIVYSATETILSASATEVVGHHVTAYLTLSTQHYWRVTAQSVCGIDSSPTAFSFTVTTPVPLPITEDFSSASGATPPAGWSSYALTNPALVWHFDNPGGRALPAGAALPAAIFDSDNYNASSENALLESPVLDASTTPTVTLEFDDTFREGWSGQGIVEVFNGVTWTPVYTYGPQPGGGWPWPYTGHRVLDISALAGGVSNAQVRFHWIGDYSWWWIVDNVTVRAAMPNLVLNKTADKAMVLPGETMTYTIVVNNLEMIDATIAIVSDILPAGLTFVGPVTIEGSAGTPGSPPTLASGLTIAGNSSITLTFPVMVDGGASAGFITNTATVTSTEVVTPVAGSVTTEIGSPLQPTINVAPTNLNSVQLSNTTMTKTLTIDNIGTADLNWAIGESNSSKPSPSPAVVQSSSDGPVERLRSITPLLVDRETLLARSSSAAAVPSITDGSFELGTPNSAWSEFSLNFGTPLCNAGCTTGGGTGPRTGNFWVWFGGIGTYEEGEITQTVIIATGANYLTFYLEQISCDTAADYMEVLIDNTQVFSTTGGSSLCGNLGYVQQSVDISAFADGGTHTLSFHSESFAVNGNGSNFFVDDVSLTCDVLSDVSWASLSLINGANGPATGTSVDVTFDSTGLGIGAYNGSLCITSDDPVTPLVIVPLSLTVSLDQDSDGVPNSVEDGGPNGGDANNDGTPDSEQSHVATLPNIHGTGHSTLVGPAGSQLQNTTAITVPAPITPGIVFPHGLFSFTATNIVSGSVVSVTMDVHAGSFPRGYWKYHNGNWIDFSYDSVSETGAVISGTIVTLYIQDGGRGDADGLANGIIVDPGGPSATLDVYLPILTKDN